MRISGWRGKLASSARERLIDAAYELFANHGINSTGIDRILEVSGCAKASLYNNFGSKSALVIAFMDRREELWTRRWLAQEVESYSGDSDEKLLAIFDIFDAWFRAPGFEGCSFINVLVEAESGSDIHRSAILHLASIRSIIFELALAAKLEDPDQFAQTFHILMKGSIVSAGEGNEDAAVHARRAAELVLAGWPRDKTD